MLSEVNFGAGEINNLSFDFSYQHDFDDKSIITVAAGIAAL
jgi:hypothetical protein